MIEELPEGWALTTLREIVRNSTQKSEPGERDESLYIGLEHIEGHSSRILGHGLGKEVRSVKSVFRSGDILYGKLRPYLNKVCRPEFDGICSTDILVLQPSNAIEPGYLHRLLTSQSVVEFSVANSNGINLPRTSFESLSELEVFLPPLAEQRRIVAKIEELTARSRAARAALADVPTLLEQFRQSVLASAFRGDLTADWRAKHLDTEPASVLLARIRAERRKQFEAKYPKKKYIQPEPVENDDELPELPDSWCWASLDEVTSLIADIDHKMPKAVDDGVLFLSAKDLLNDGTLNFTDKVKRISEEDYERLSRKAKPTRGDIIYSRIGARLGKARLVETNLRFLVSYSCCTIRPLVDGVFLALHLDREETLRRAIGDSQSIGVPDLGLDRIKEFSVPLCPEMEQKEVVRVLGAALSAVRKIESQAREWASALDQLDQSILAKAFRGELVPQDPTDEPASALLERIRSGQSERKDPREVTGGRLSRIVLLLLHHWNNAASRELVDRGVLLMLDDDLRQRLASGGTKPKRKKGGTPTPATPISFPHLLGAMIDAEFVTAKMKGPVQTLRANTQKAKLAHDSADPADLARLRETMKVMELIEAKQLDAELAEAFRGQEIAITV